VVRITKYGVPHYETFFQIPFNSSVLGPDSSLRMQRRQGKDYSDAVNSYIGHCHSVAGKLEVYERKAETQTINS